MIDKLQSHVDTLFAGVPRSRRVDEAREELLSGCLDRYRDLTEDGVDPSEAYRRVVSSIGDVDELLRDLLREDAADPLTVRRNTRRRSLFLAVSVSLYFLAVAVLLLITEFVPAPEEAGAIAFMLVCAAATGLLIYGLGTSRAEPAQRPPTLAEAVRTQISGDENQTRNRLKGALSSTLWCLVVILYFGLSLATHSWEWSWLIFPLGALVQNAILFALSNSPQKKRTFWGLFWTGGVFLYLFLSILTNRWDLTWLLFPIVLCAQQAARLYRIWKDVG
ncbi:MAG: permease prefix domain 1-containing protein [Oscillospiraceae bacterium]|jgi:MFS family permease|nr:permease prefix domain 1-containing protein [Oscillospiraceae bacterium]